MGLVAELVDAVDSKSTGLAHLGSTPSEATKSQQHIANLAGFQPVSHLRRAPLRCPGPDT
jgi:hypothetical protein